MATRLSFGIFGKKSTGQLIDGIAIEVKDASDNVVASTTPSTNQQLVVGNGDGTYYVDGLSTGEYDIYTAGVLQQELKVTPFISTAGLNNINNAVTYLRYLVRQLTTMQRFGRCIINDTISR